MKGKIRYSEIVLPILILAIIFTVDIALTTAASWNIDANDEVTVRGLFSVNLYRVGSPWTASEFNIAYGKSLFTSIILTIIYMASVLIDRVRFNK